jgi:hypothetical protein
MKINISAFAMYGITLLASVDCNAQSHQIKRRADSYFGVHFDFHANKTDNQIGSTLTPQMVNTFLNQVKVDYIQVDTKGHTGISSYLTKVGVPAPRIANDPLKIFRAATRNKGIALYSHFSGVMDAEAVKNHPDWARINADGKTDGSATSIFGGYCDNYFIPQIKELSQKYGVDGVWIDGDCWAVQADFSNNATQAYNKATGNKGALTADYMRFTRKAFHQYLNHYTQALHQYNPKLQLASNWAFSSYMPGKIDAGVDFLSGDVVTDDHRYVNFEARVMANMGKPWDLMVWGFMGDKDGQGHYWKTARMLKQKTAMIIAQGGGSSIYINQNRDASLPLNTIPVLKEVAEFCWARKPYCFKSTAVPQIALLFSGAGHDYDLGTSVAFNQNNGGNDNIKGTLSMLLNSQYAVQVLQEFSLTNTLSKYPLLVITEWNYLEPAFIKHVENYIHKGGKVLVIGGVSCNMFKQALPAGTAVKSNNTATLPVKTNQYGKGTIIGVDANISLNYLNNPDEKVRQTIAALVQQLFPSPIVKITGSNKVQLSISKLNNATQLHLINVGDSFKIIDNKVLGFQLPAIGKFNVSYQTRKKPVQIKMQPGNISLQYTYANGVAKFNVPGIDVYSIIEIK